MLIAAPNLSEGRDADSIEAVTAGFIAAAELLDRHSDGVHNRTVLTLRAPAGELREALAGGAAACAERIDMRRHRGAHPCVGALDVCPVVFPDAGDRESARREVLAAAELIAALEIPVFLYGDLASEPGRRERAHFRDGGLATLAQRMRSGELRPDLGPAALHPRAGATLVTARPPLAAFNVELADADLALARRIAAELRESGGGPAGVRAIGIDMGDGRMQVSANVHDPIAVPLAEVVARIRRLAKPHGARPVAAEIVGLVPVAALEGFPEEVPIAGFDPERHLLERRARPASG